MQNKMLIGKVNVWLLNSWFKTMSWDEKKIRGKGIKCVYIVYAHNKAHRFMFIESKDSITINIVTESTMPYLKNIYIQVNSSI